MNESERPIADGVVVRQDHTPWLIPDYHEPVWLGESVLRDRKGRSHRNAHTRFAVIVCNNPGCEFTALLDPEEVIRERLGGRLIDGYESREDS